MGYKLICIDMDGTLLNNEHTVSEKNKRVLKEATDRGIKVGISTGRVFASARIFAKLIGIKAPLICSNGSYIREKDSDKVIFKSVLDKEELDAVYDIIKKYKFLAFFDTPYGIISDKEIPEDDSHRIMNKLTSKEEAIQFYVVEDFKEAFKKYSDDILKLILIEEEGSKKIQDAKKDLEKIKGIDVVYSWAGCAEIMREGTSKGKGVEILAKKLGIKKEEIMCIGDSGNDISMLEAAGTAVVMGNAPKEIKKIADYITDTNINNGVAKAVEKLVLHK